MASEKAAARHFLAHQLVHGFGCEARHILLRSAPVFRLEALEGSAPKNKRSNSRVYFSAKFGTLCVIFRGLSLKRNDDSATLASSEGGFHENQDFGHFRWDRVAALSRFGLRGLTAAETGTNLVYFHVC